MYAVKINPPHISSNAGISTIFFALPIHILGYTEEMDMDKSLELAKAYCKDKDIKFNISYAKVIGNSHILVQIEEEHLYCIKVTYEEIEVI